MFDDYLLIESSFAQQYGIRLRNEKKMSWDEFTSLLSGLLPESPLGKIVEVRSESDKDILKHFTKDQHRIRNEWRSKIAQQYKQDTKSADSMISAFQDMMRKAYSKESDIETVRPNEK